MAGPKKPILLSQTSNSASSYNSLYFNPLTSVSPNNKENVAPAVASTGCTSFNRKNKIEQLQLHGPGTTATMTTSTMTATKPFKPSSLQLCMKLTEPEPDSGVSKKWDPLAMSSSSDAWDFSDSEAAPASSWSTLPNRSLLCRPLPMDVGRCTCIIVKESLQEMKGITIFSLYTNEGQGRQDRKLAVARHTRQNGRSKFVVAQNSNGLLLSSTSNEGLLGTITANLMGSKFHIWDQGRVNDFLKTPSKSRLLGVVGFVPTIATLTGSFRVMKAWIPKQQSMQLKNTNSNSQISHISGLPKDWEEKRNRAHQLYSREPYYNNVTKRYELDFRERAGRSAPKIQTSVKNFQLTMEEGCVISHENAKQTLLQLGKIGKSAYTMDYRYPLTGYLAFCICLASIDSKLCCSV